MLRYPARSGGMTEHGSMDNSGEWDGTRTRDLGAALKGFLKESGVGWMLSHRDIVDAWLTAVGPDNAEKTRIAGWRNGTLTVDVFSPTLKSELEGFYREATLASIKEAAPQIIIRAIKFRLASPEAYDSGA